MTVLFEYQRALGELEKAKAELFYHGSEVDVYDPRYQGPGLAVTDGQCPPDQVAVSLPNGNTWWYPIDAVTVTKPYRSASHPSSSVSIRV